MGYVGGCDDSVTGVVAGLLVHVQVADAVSLVSSRRAGRGAGRIHPWFRHGDLPRARLALRLVSHLVVRLVAIVLPSMCFSCVFFIPFSGGMRLLDLSPCPSRSSVSSPRLVVRLGRRRIVMCCLLDLPRWRSSHLVLSPRQAGRGAKRSDETS